MPLQNGYYRQNDVTTTKSINLTCYTAISDSVRSKTRVNSATVHNNLPSTECLDLLSVVLLHVHIAELDEGIQFHNLDHSQCSNSTHTHTQSNHQLAPRLDTLQHVINCKLGLWLL